MKLLKKISVALLIAVICFGFASCGRTNNNSLVGTWTKINADGIYFFWYADEIEFFRDGTVFESSDGEWGKWSVVDDNKLRVIEDSDGSVFIYDFNIRNNILTITDEDYDINTYRKLK